MMRAIANERSPARVICLRSGDTFLRRLRGLLFTRSLPPDEGLLLAPCNGVHMMGMLYALDIVYLDQTLRVVKIARRLRPFIGVSICPSAAMALELAAGGAAGWQVGDQLKALDEKASREKIL